MFVKNADFPPYKWQLKEIFGALSFNCALINLDIIGIRMVLSGEVIVIAYRGSQKIGYFYEGDKLSAKAVFNGYNDVPTDWNELEAYEKEYEGRIELLVPPKDNYVFINDIEISKK